MAQSVNQNDDENVKEYANKVGKTLSQAMLLYRY